MPSNKQRDLQKKANETTGKNEMIHHTVGLCPVLEKDVVKYKLMKIGFTASGECVSIEEVADVKSETAAFIALRKQLEKSGALNLRSLRSKVKELQADKNRKESNENSN